jgi:Ca2+-transporting ATPase
MEQTIPERITEKVNGDSWHAVEADEVLSRLATFSERGLSSKEAERRLQRYGPNELEEAPGTTFWQMLGEQFNNFVVILLIIAAIISAALGDYVESAAIIAIVILNATLGVVQERRAEQELAALRKLAAPDADVIRDGSREVLPAQMLVPGDLVLLEAGNYVPADIRLIEAVNLRVEEAALTGESVPVQKDAAISL